MTRHFFIVRLPLQKRKKIVTTLRAVEKDQLLDFLRSLESSLTRRLKSIRIIPVFGTPFTVRTVAEAVSLVKAMDVSTPGGTFLRYEVRALYTNGDEVKGEFHNNADALRFLEMLK